MALKKMIDTVYGVSGEYLKIETFSFYSGTVYTGILTLYANEAARRAGKNALERRGFTVPVGDIDNKKAIFPQLYAAVKELPDYADAEDC